MTENETVRMYMTEFDLLADGIVGREVAWECVPKGCDAFQYALGKVEIDGEVAIFRRRSSERGTYGGWRWEGYASRLRPARAIGSEAYIKRRKE